MLLLIAVIIGFALGRLAGADRHGFFTIGTISLAAAGSQIALVAMTTDRSNATLLPIVLGGAVVAGMLVGGAIRPRIQSHRAA